MSRLALDAGGCCCCGGGGRRPWSKSTFFPSLSRGRRPWSKAMFFLFSVLSEAAWSKAMFFFCPVPVFPSRLYITEAAACVQPTPPPPSSKFSAISVSAKSTPSPYSPSTYTGQPTATPPPPSPASGTIRPALAPNPHRRMHRSTGPSDMSVAGAEGREKLENELVGLALPEAAREGLCVRCVCVLAGAGLSWRVGRPSAACCTCSQCSSTSCTCSGRQKVSERPAQ